MANDEWIPSLPGPAPDPTDPLPPANSWNSAEACVVDPDSPSIVTGIVLTGVPAVLGSAMNGNYVWSLTLNDGASPPNFTIDHYDASGNLVNNPLEFSGVNGAATFATPVFLSRDPVQPMEAATKEYVDASVPGFFDAPRDGQLYGRSNGAWATAYSTTNPANYQTAAQVTATLAGYMPLSGGTFTGPVTFPANNSLAIVGAAGTQRAILAGTSGPPVSYRWQMLLGDQAAESGGNAGSNFALNSISDTGTIIGTPLAITRATGAITVGVVPGVTPLTINGPATAWRSIAGATNGSMRWQMFLGSPNAELGGNLGSNFQLTSYTDAGAAMPSPLTIARATGVATFSALPSFPGGVLNYALVTNGAGVLAWAPNGLPDAPTDGVTYARQNAAWVPTAGGGGGIPEAPNDGTAYARKSQAWAHLTHTDITDWTATLGGYLPLTGGTLTGTLNGTVVNTTGAIVAGVVGSGSLSVGNTASTNSLLLLSSAAGSNSYIQSNKGGSNRWQMLIGNSVAETGANAGSDFVLRGYADNGTTIIPSLTITRSTGVAAFSAIPVHPTPTAGDNSTNSATTAFIAGGYLPLTGGTITGSLVANANLTGLGVLQAGSAAAANAQCVLSCAVAGTAYISGYKAGVVRWQLVLGNPTAETGGDTGSDFELRARHDDGTAKWTAIGVNRNTGVAAFSATPTHPTPTAGDSSTNSATTAFVNTALGGYLPLTGGTMSGPPRISGAAGTARIAFTGQTAGVARWNVVLGTGTAETGANAGSDFRIDGYNDAGSAVVNSPLTITRSTGVAAFVAAPTFPTPAPGNNSTNGATTAFVQAAIAAQPIMGDNRIINGDMRIDQRNNGASGTAGLSTTFTVDRWKYLNTSGAVRGTWGRNLNSVGGPVGFPYYLGFQSSSAYTSVTTDAIIISQSIEVDQVSDLAWGTVNAQPVTLSFWARSSLTGTFGGVVGNYLSTRSYPFTYSIPTANTWTRIILNIPGDTTGNYAGAGGNDGSISVIFDLGSGPSSRGGTANTWSAVGSVGPTGTVSVVATNAATFQLTGIKLEIGSIATPFNHPPLAQALVACQRYYQTSFWNGPQYGAAAGVANMSSVVIPTAMRAAPTVTFSAPSYSNCSALTLQTTDIQFFIPRVTVTAAGAFVANSTYTLSAEL